MFHFLSKFLPLFIYPLSLACIFLLAALRAKSRKQRNALILGAVGLLWILGNGWVAGWIVRSLEWQYLPLEEYPQVDAIVILGGGTYPADYPRPIVEVNGGGDRVIYGARLYNQGLAPRIILTGGNLSWEDGSASPAQDMLALLLEMGIPEEAVLLEGESANTYENAVLTRRLAEPLGIDRILLVTSALHMPRSAPLFENQGFTVVPAPTDYNVTRMDEDRPLSETWPTALFNFFPNAYSLAGTTAAMKEYIGIGVYWLRGWW